ncbi:MAG: hypothetical protein J6K16_07055 [Alphaproteobacteria bacterium]|nr:hypothetical protein [Alphaproteobacteria bacterium]
MKTYPSGSEAVKGNESAFKGLTAATKRFFEAPETQKHFPKEEFKLPTLMAMKDCQNG